MEEESLGIIRKLNSVYIVHHEHDVEDHIDGFSISKYELDKDHWTEGFITHYWNDEDEDV